MPNMQVFRPADAIETAECWALAIKRADGPSTLALTRQGLPPLRHDVSVNLCEKGGYRLKAADAEKRVVLIATGSEVSLAMDIAAKLEAAGHGADVVSMPCTELFDAQSADYRQASCGCRSRPGPHSAGSAIRGSTACASVSTVSERLPRLKTSTPISV